MGLILMLPTLGSSFKRFTLAGKTNSCISSDGLPILFGVVTLGSEQPGPLWVIDGVRMGTPPSIG